MADDGPQGNSPWRPAAASGEPSRFEVRPARADEVGAAHALEVLCYLPAEAASLERFAGRHARFPDGFLLLLEGGALRALIVAVRTRLDDLGDEHIKEADGHDPCGPDLVVLSVATHPDHRRRGLAGRLVDALGERARGMPALLRLRLVCKPPLVPFYARHGYVHVGPSRSNHGGARWEDMERTP